MLHFLLLGLAALAPAQTGGAAPTAGPARAAEQSPESATAPLRVACVGDSITFGSGLVRRERHAWPVLLGGLLGEGYAVRNFGVGSATLLAEADKPWSGQPACRELMAWRPQVVVVMLGTNDTCDNERRPNWRLHAALADDARALAARLREESGAERVLFCTPPRMFPDRPGLAEARADDLRERAPRLEAIDAALHEVCAPQDDGVDLVELRDVLRAGWTTDGVHLTPHGSDAIALRVAAALQPGLDRPAPLVARPSVEWRGPAAGWGQGDWHDALSAMRAQAEAHRDARVVFLGDSITQSLTGHARRWAGPADATKPEREQRAVDRFFGAGGALSLGLSGDRTEHLLWRIRHGALPLLKPEVIVLQVGINNLNTGGDSPAVTAAGIEAVVAALRAAQPQARVVICGPFPGGREPGHPLRTGVDSVHERIARLRGVEQVDYLDLRDRFLREDGSANDLLARDGIHITEAGRRMWMAALHAHLEQTAD